jgi:hypothetical protein
MTSQGSSGELLSSMISTPISTRCTADPIPARAHLSSGILAAAALIGSRLVSGNKNHWFAGWVLERKITDKLMLGVELFHQTPDKIDGLQATGSNIGGIYDFTDHFHFLFSFGKGFQHARETNELSWYIGLEMTGGE